jgi:hypothetical protein
MYYDGIYMKWLGKTTKNLIQVVGISADSNLAPPEHKLEEYRLDN